MLKWFVQPYRRVDSFDAPIPFATIAVAIEAANTMLRNGKYDRIRIYHATFPEIRMDIESPCVDVMSLAAEIEGRVRIAAETVTVGTRQAWWRNTRN